MTTASSLATAAWMLLVLTGLQGPGGRDRATFIERIELYDSDERQLAEATGTNERGQAALAWLEALGRVLRAVPIERTGDPIYREWLDAHRALVVYSEPSGEWLVRNDLIWRVHDEHRVSAAADDIAWIAATNGIPGECEGYVPCYASGVNQLQGEYLRRHPEGRHRREALERIAEILRLSVDDLLTRADASDFLEVPDDCPDLAAALEPLRRAVVVVADQAAPPALVVIDRLSAYCAPR